MPDREKVIRELKAARLFFEMGSNRADGVVGNLGCKSGMKYIDDAVDLLKEQEHSETFIVIDNKTGEEADTYDIALHEDWAKHLCYCDMEGWAIEDDGTLLLVDECGQFAYADRERFKVKWE